MNYGERLKLLRKQKQLTLRELSKEIHVSFSTLGKYERSEREPDFETLNKLADFYDVSTDYIMCRTDDRNLYRNQDEAKSAIKRKVLKFKDEDLSHLPEKDIELINEMIERIIKSNND